MSFLAGRLAGTEGAYFLQESKLAVSRLVQKSKPKLPSSTSESPIENEAQADVLPEILRHSLPSKIFEPPSESTLSTASKWVVHSHLKNASSISRGALNPLRAYISLPQVTFGPKRWQLPNTGNSVSASTANDLRRDKYTPVDPEKVKASAFGLSRNAKVYAVAIAAVVEGATWIFGLSASKIEVHNSDDIKAKGKELVQPKVEMIRGQLMPLKNWVADTSKKWHLEREEDIKEKPLIKGLTRIMGTKKTPN